MREETPATYQVGNPTTITEDEKEILAQAAKIYQHLAIHGDTLTSPSLVKNWVKAELVGELSEVFAIVWLDNKHRAISFEKMFFGTIDGASVYPREIARSALNHNAAACFLVHNHPSGNATPSRADELITERIKRTLGAIEVRILDHLIVGDEVVSLAELGKM